MEPILTHQSKKSKIPFNCDTRNCQQKVQGVCFECNTCLCYKCSLTHIQSNQTHGLLDIDESIKHISKTSTNKLKQFEHMKSAIQQYVEQGNSQNIENKLHPQLFQQQLDQIAFLKQETLKIVQKFFSEISLELVNIWETYLKSFMAKESVKVVYQQLQKNMKKMSDPWKIKSSPTEIIRQYLQLNFDKDLQQIRNKVTTVPSTEIPRNPQLFIQERVLIQIQQLLCNSICTINFRKTPLTQNKINITKPNYLENTPSTASKTLPIFPIKKQSCYLYDLKEKVYEIQQFAQLQCLPAYPKSILLPNGDLHIIGGLLANGNLSAYHSVFRSSTAQVFKLNNLPTPRNPSNSLVYHKQKIYLIGGMVEGNQWDVDCLCYDLNNKEWKKMKSMNYAKPHQSLCCFEDSIYCFGIPEAKRLNIEKYSINQNAWKQIKIENLLSNPFNFAAGFSCVQINSAEILLFGGKKYHESPKTKKRSTDLAISPYFYTFRPENNSFVQIGKLHPGLGVQYGQVNPIIFNGRIYSVQFLVSKKSPIVRWYETMQICQISSDGSVQSVMILHED